MTANLVMNLGVTELVRSSLEWDEKNRYFVGKATSGAELVITFEFTDGLPKRAIIVNPLKGGPMAFIDYEYSQSIFNGELPHSFTRHSGSPSHDLGKAFLVDLLVMELATNRPAGMVLDPLALFHPRTTSFYSNDLTYMLAASGKTTKALTIAEYEASLASIRGSKTATGRIIVVSAMGLFSIILGSSGKRVGDFEG